MTNDVYIRVDHGNGIGDGHLYRCKALAAALEKEKFNVIFVTRPRIGFEEKKFMPFKLVQLKAIQQINDWLGVTEEEDALECLELVKNKNKVIWVVDQYGIGETWEKILKSSNQKIVAIDDLSRKHYADIIIDQNITADEKKYTHKDSFNKCKYLMGPEYSLLREDIIHANPYKEPEDESYLLFLGTAPDELFYKYLEVLREFSLTKLDILNPPKNFKNLKNENPIDFCSDMPTLYSKQKLVFGSCGVSNIERMALGVPSVTAVIADNQVEVGKKLKELDVGFHLGDLREITQEELKKRLSDVLAKPRHLVLEKIEFASQLISRQGTQKVAKIMTAL